MPLGDLAPGFISLSPAVTADHYGTSEYKGRMDAYCRVTETHEQQLFTAPINANIL